ncbi:cysteine desulfurase IscS [Novimethylophilus kurashikiensis]|uniref:Cysteine desulfurase IscS n=1 Tax=Novimethylophilus kurashikiensis TaxID=1825523 RepID=A0A2R5F326_9PROT|nr:hypothetical protein [Novimethylophilus kurashikiensis]GBG12559.1 cysteine desulfurase IscS [Novimethylophilus kurashikiensis]
MAVSGVTLSAGAIGAYAAQAQGGTVRQNGGDSSTQTGSSTSFIVRLSPQAQIKSSLEDLQAKAQALQNFSKSPNLQDFKIAVQGVVSAINAVRQSADIKQSDFVAQQKAQSVTQSVFGDNGENKSTLQKAGLQVQENGQFSINQNTLDSALANNREGTVSAFTQLASRAESAAGKQPGIIGNNDRKTENLSASNANNSSNSDEARLAAQKRAQALADQLALASGYAARNAVASYSSINSL